MVKLMRKEVIVVSLFFEFLTFKPYRLFPVGRGLYEDKVANVWCTLAPVIKLRQLLSRASLLRLSTATTLLAVLPSSWNLLWNPVPYRFILALVSLSEVCADRHRLQVM